MPSFDELIDDLPLAAEARGLVNLGERADGLLAPTGAARTVAANGSVSDGGGSNPLTGYSLLNADNLDAAVNMAKGCPILKSGGSVEVAETIDM